MSTPDATSMRPPNAWYQYVRPRQLGNAVADHLVGEDEPHCVPGDASGALAEGLALTDDSADGQPDQGTAAEDNETLRVVVRNVVLVEDETEERNPCESERSESLERVASRNA